MPDISPSMEPIPWPGAAAPHDRILVWDGFVRFFHWSLVGAFVASYWSAKAGKHELHAWLGYFILGLVLARVFWGVFGSRHARFSDFVHAPGEVLSYLKAIAVGRPPRYLGHNPAGGFMVLTLLVILIFIAFTGLIVLAAIDFDGPLAGVTRVMSDQWAYAIQDMHSLAVNVILIIVPLHLLGVALAGVQHHENLVQAMITGYKTTRTAMPRQ